MAVGLVAVVALGLATAAWTRRLPAGSRPGSPAAVGTPSVGASPLTDSIRWLRVIDDLDAVRSTAYERGDVGMLTTVWAPGPRLRADAAQLRALLAHGCTARGVRHRFGALSVLAVRGPRVHLRVVQWLPVSQRVRAGQVVGRLAGSPPTAVPVDLLATERGWRLG